MTRKTALQKALCYLSEMEQTNEIREIHSKIGEVIDAMPFTCWDASTIFDTLEQFALEHARTPTVTDLNRKGMPSHSVIKNRFKMNAKDFLNQYFPPARDARKFSTKTREEWKKQFIEILNTKGGNTAEGYNKTRPPGSPSWATVAAMFGVKKWSDWIQFCGLSPNTKRSLPKNKRLELNYTITVKSELQDEIKDMFGK